MTPEPEQEAAQHVVKITSSNTGWSGFESLLFTFLAKLVKCLQNGASNNTHSWYQITHVRG